MNLQQAKALFFAQHLGQKFYMHPDWESFNDNRPMIVDSRYLKEGSNRLSSGYLLLKSVSDLTDEEKGPIANLSYMGGWSYPKYADELLDNYMDKQSRVNGTQWWFIKDYLLRLGVLIPFTYLDENNEPVTLSPEQIIDLGWAKLDKVKNGKK